MTAPINPAVASRGTIKLSSPATHQVWEIPVLHEDQDLLAIEKPAGLLTSPDRCDPNLPSLLKLLHGAISERKPWVVERNLKYLMAVHRLDLDTSGVLLLAKNKPALVALANLFGSEKPIQTYVALVKGSPGTDQFQIDARLAPHPAKAPLVRVDPRRGKRARTQVEALERFAGYTLLKCVPLTARTHQIRVHLRYVRLPIVADPLYGCLPLMLSSLKPDYHLKPNKTERPLISRTALHAESLTLSHPVSGQPVAISSPWPKDLTVALKYLRRYAAA